MKIYINEYIYDQILEIKEKEKSYNFSIEKAQIIIHQLTNITHDNIDENGFISVHSELFRKLTFRDYNKYLNSFVKHGLLERKNYFAQKHKCNKYRIRVSNKLIVSNIEVSIEKHSLIKKLKNRIMPSAKQKYAHLFNWISDEDFTIDYNGAIDKINGSDIKSCIKTNLIQSVNAIRDKNIRFICHSSDKRLHTNITNLKSFLRQFLYYKNKKLVNVDLKNSQIYFLAMLLLLIKHNKEIIIDNNTIILHIPSESIDATELKRFVDLTIQGNFYPVLGQELIDEVGYNNTYEKRKFNSKKKMLQCDFYDNPKLLMKPIIFEVLFSRNETTSNEKKWFSKKFPTICAVLMKIKEVDYKKLAILLQNFESDVILNKVIKHISKNHPNIFMLTIHDSIMTLPEHANIVQKAIVDITRDSFGYSPKLSIE